ncbi:MAG: hypothetical protein JO218_14075, partial [Burkholderiales bacterium]|nr:hypothetical protein [Burkholderiales bacterium]
MSLGRLLSWLQSFNYRHWAALFGVLVALDYSVLDASRMIDLRAGDVLLRLHSTQVPPSSGVVVVDIDQRSLE